MPKYQISASETVYYLFEVEASDEDSACEMVYEGEADFDYTDVDDTDGFEINRIIEVK